MVLFFANFGSFGVPEPAAGQLSGMLNTLVAITLLIAPWLILEKLNDLQRRLQK